ncbi:MAG: class I SAM-dependent RNA methyltransferase, partial [Verrucomicrobiales bacterium]
VQPAIPSPRQYAYRSKLTPHFQKPKSGETPRIGFLVAGRRSQVLDVPKCLIAMDEINEALPAERARVIRNADSYKHGATLLLRATEGRVETNPRSPVTEKVRDLTFHFLAGDFFQNNPYILPAFTDYVAEKASADGQRFLLDAYCGSGLFALTLASRFEKVTGIEVSETSADWARRNAATNGLTHTHFIAASAENLFADISDPAAETTVIIDPPRKGSSPAFLSQLFAYGPSRVVYISCNPATQMRDLTAFLEAGYELEEIQPFDLFPQTRHLECVITLRKN